MAHGFIVSVFFLNQPDSQSARDESAKDIHSVWKNMQDWNIYAVFLRQTFV